MKPYYEDAYVTLYHGDCRSIDLPGPDEVTLLLADPPYGIDYRTSASRGRAVGGGSAWAASHAWQPIVGDAVPFDPTPWLPYRAVLFGANHYASRLPDTGAWLVWDKIDGLTTDERAVGINDSSDVELAWTNLGGPARILRHRWLGLMKATERRCHPTQKPVALMARIIEWRTKSGDLVLDPYAGSGPVLVAAKRLGRRAVGVEIEEPYCEVIAKRLAQGVLDFGAAS